eukprot:2676482-Ditylum_brightwellii.AAC.1
MEAMGKWCFSLGRRPLKQLSQIWYILMLAPSATVCLQNRMQIKAYYHHCTRYDFVCKASQRHMKEKVEKIYKRVKLKSHEEHGKISLSSHVMVIGGKEI